MRKGRSILAQVVEQTNRGVNTAVCQTIIEIVGEKRVLIENHRGIITYGKEEIVIKVMNGSVLVCGSSLEIIHMTKDKLVITGIIHSISLQRRELL